MKARREPLGTVLIVCCGGAVLALAVGLVVGSWRGGVALALGLLVGASNGFIAKRMLETGTGFAFTSLGRLALLSAVGLGLAALLGLQFAPLLLLGIAGAQVILAVTSSVAAVRQ